MVQRIDQFPQAGYPQTVVPGQERAGRSLVGGLPRTDLHCINLTTMAQGTIAHLVRDDAG
jgi:hypothetical protein